MGNFEDILKFTLEHEGGLVDNEADPGGMTNLGISFRFLKGLNSKYADVNNDGTVDEHDIEDMTVEQASKIYKIAFWDACKCDHLPYPVDCVIFDTSVNMGTRTAIKMLQRTLNKYNAELIEDGDFGPKTKLAVRNITDNKLFATDYLQSRRNYYTSLADAKPKFRQFLKGWLNRCNDLREFVESA